MNRESESDRGQIAKMPTGIRGFDEIARGGLPRERTTLLAGGPGTGKTIFALQTLVNGVRRCGEPGIFVAFEENSRQVIANAESFGWGLAALENDGLFFLDARLSADTVKAGAFDLQAMLAGLNAKAKQMKATRIVFDSVDVLLALLDDALAQRQELYRLHDWLQQSGLTGLVTARTEGGEAIGGSHGFLQFMADCVVGLQNRVADRVALRELRIVKYRGSGFEQNEFPMTIGPEGIEVGSFGIKEKEYPVSEERISSGVASLDTMLDGGFYRGSSILITGSPGTAKTTLSGSFLQAACSRGERSVFFGFDESAGEIIRNLRSVGIRLGPLVDAGMLRIHTSRSEARSAEEHLLLLSGLMDEYKPVCMVIDPISAMVKAGGHHAALTVAQRLIHLTKSRGTTLMVTSLLEGSDPSTEGSQIRVSTIADVWIHLSYLVRGGERNRALSIVKARGAAHSNQVRELVLTDTDATLEDVYTAGGEVLMGTLRYEKEVGDSAARERERLEVEHKRRELELAEAEMKARIATLGRELEARRFEIARLDEEERIGEQRHRAQREEVRRRRQEDDTSFGGEGVS